MTLLVVGSAILTWIPSLVLKSPSWSVVQLLYLLSNPEMRFDHLNKLLIHAQKKQSEFWIWDHFASKFRETLIIWANGCKQKYSSAKLVSFTAVFSVTTQRSDCMTTLKPAAKETSAKHQLLNLFMVTKILAHEYWVMLCRIPQREFLGTKFVPSFLVRNVVIANKMK